MKIYIVKSTQSKIPLAEIRTAGDQVDFVVDNSNGAIPKMANGSFKELARKVASSSHLSLEEPTKATVSMFRYVLNNGDVAEISSDGHTCILNGKMLEPEEKEALFSAIQRGEIKVTRKTDGNHAQPILPTTPIPKPIPAQNFISKTALESMRKEQRDNMDIDKNSTADYDYGIESGDFRGSEDPEYAKRMLYVFKYGQAPRRMLK